METTTSVPSTLMEQLRNICMDGGMLASTVSMSLLKRLTMRPMGVVSKNTMGRRSTVDKRLAWSFPEARRAPSALSATASQINAPAGTGKTNSSVTVYMVQHSPCPAEMHHRAQAPLPWWHSVPTSCRTTFLKTWKNVSRQACQWNTTYITSSHLIPSTVLVVGGI